MSNHTDIMDRHVAELKAVRALMPAPIRHQLNIAIDAVNRAAVQLRAWENASMPEPVEVPRASQPMPGERTLPFDLRRVSA